MCPKASVYTDVYEAVMIAICLAAPQKSWCGGVTKVSVFQRMKNTVNPAPDETVSAPRGHLGRRNSVVLTQSDVRKDTSSTGNGELGMYVIDTEVELCIAILTRARAARGYGAAKRRGFYLLTCPG